MSEKFRWRHFEIGDAFWGFMPFFREIAVAPAKTLARAFELLPPEQGLGDKNPPPSGLALFEQVFALGPALVARHGMAVAETLDAFDSSRFWRRRDEKFFARAWAPKIAKIDGDVLWLRRFGDGDDFYVLLDLIPRLAVAARFCDLSALRVAIPRLPERQSRRFIELLALFGVAETQVFALGDEARWFRRVMLPLPLVAENAGLSPAAVEVLSFLPARFKTVVGPAKIFLMDAADDPRWRPALENLGFVAIDADSERFAALAPLLGAARWVAAGPNKLALSALAPQGVGLVLLDGAREPDYRELAALKRGEFFALAGGNVRALASEQA